MFRRTLLSGLAVSALGWQFPTAGPLSAQEYPTRTITIVVPLAAGSGMDTVARLYAEELQKSLGRSVVVENQPGAALMLAAQNVARAAPDGYTLVVSTAAPMAVNPTLYKKVNYDPDKDFVPISLYVKSPFVLITGPSFSATSAMDFIKKAQASDKPIPFGTSGTGTVQHLTMESLKREFKFAADHVPYRSSPQIVTDVVGGHLASSMSEMGAALALIRDGKITAHAITSATRHPSLPNVPTFAEALSRPGFEAVSWHVLMAPAATPQPVVQRLHAEMSRITGNPAFQTRATEIGLTPVPPASVAEIDAYIRAERKRWREAVTALGLAGSQ
jgi:tripartite-type tricarboxylate transporter receptor subunit TctC